MRKKRIFNLLMVGIPWFSVLFIGKRSFFRFLPIASFVSLFLCLYSAVANSRKWWVNKSPIIPGNQIDFTYIFGPYFVGTIWIFKLTYGNFRKYLITNLIVNTFNLFPFFYLSERFGMVKFVKMKYRTWFSVTMVTSLLIYVVHSIIENSILIQKKNPKTEANGH